MNDYLLKKWIDFRHCDEGVTLVEYGIAIILAVTVGTAALAALGLGVTNQMGQATALLP